MAWHDYWHIVKKIFCLIITSEVGLKGRQQGVGIGTTITEFFGKDPSLSLSLPPDLQNIYISIPIGSISR